MRRPTFYSGSAPGTSQAGDSSRDAAPASDLATSAELSGQQAQQAEGASRLRRLAGQLRAPNSYFLWAMVLALSVLLAASLTTPWRPGARQLTQQDINAAVLKTLETTVLPSAAAKAYQTILPSVVRVVATGKAANFVSGQRPEPDDPTGARSVGTGVVIVEKGVILTNLHVVQGAETIKVTFSDGLQTSASMVGSQPENDLAVLQAHSIPDDMIAAAMRPSTELAPGDQVMAVGFPFGIGPSASAGIVSGLKRSFRSPEGKQEMNNLIQFDAAANPGNSGGPLVTMDGHVVGIVTAIFNPNRQQTFVGIGFAVPIENAAAAAGAPPF